MGPPLVANPRVASDSTMASVTATSIRGATGAKTRWDPVPPTDPVPPSEDGETLQLRVDILEAELDGAKMAAFDRLVRKKDEEKDEALARQAAEKDEEKEAALAALRAELTKD